MFGDIGCKDSFYYKNIETYHSWEKDGRTEENHKDMVILLFEDRQCTIVHEGLDEDDVTRIFNSSLIENKLHKISKENLKGVKKC